MTSGQYFKNSEVYIVYQTIIDLKNDSKRNCLSRIWFSKEQILARSNADDMSTIRDLIEKGLYLQVFRKGSGNNEGLIRIQRIAESRTTSLLWARNLKKKIRSLLRKRFGHCLEK